MVPPGPPAEGSGKKNQGQAAGTTSRKPTRCLVIRVDSMLLLLRTVSQHWPSSFHAADLATPDRSGL